MSTNKKFYYTKLDIARIIAIEGFWKAAEYIDPEIILNQDLADNFRDLKDIEKIIKKQILERFSEYFNNK